MATEQPSDNRINFPQDFWRELLLGVAAFLIYLALAKAGSALQYTEFRSSPWSPATAISVAAGLRSRWWSIPVILFAYLANDIFSPPHFGIYVLLPLAIAHVTAFTVAPALLYKFLAQKLEVSTRTVVIAIITVVALALFAAAVRMLTLENAYSLSFGSTLRTSLSQAVGNIVGILTIMPILLVARSNLLLWLPWTIGDGINLAAILGVVFLVFGVEGIDEFKFFYVLFLPVIVFALRRGFAGAALSTLATNLLMLTFLILRSIEPPVISELQILMISLSFTGLTLGAAISERMRVAADLQESQGKLLRSARISLAGEMASALSHELNQPLSAARSYVRSAIRRMQKGSKPENEAIEDLHEAVKVIDAMAVTVKAVRQFVKRDDDVFHEINVAQWVKDTVKLVEAEFKKSGIRIDTQLPVGRTNMHGNYVQLQQVLVNLLRNAREAKSQNSPVTRITISVSSRNRPGNVEVIVVDDGPGLPQNVRNQLFSPLVSSKAEGLGLGLSLCKTILRNHGGDIWLAHSDASETAFAFTVPGKKTNERQLE